MSLGRRVFSDHQLARLLQIGVVLEEVVEARAARHIEALAAAGDPDGPGADAGGGVDANDAGSVDTGRGAGDGDRDGGADAGGDVGHVDPSVQALLEDAAAESAEHRRRLESLIEELDAETVAYEQIETLVREKYAANSPEDFDGVLYDQLCNEETAYKFYDDLIDAIEGSEADLTVDRDRVLETLRTIREEEAEGVEAVTRVMEETDASVEFPPDHANLNPGGAGDRTPGWDSGDREDRLGTGGGREGSDDGAGDGRGGKR